MLAGRRQLMQPQLSQSTEHSLWCGERGASLRYCSQIVWPLFYVLLQLSRDQGRVSPSSCRATCTLTTDRLALQISPAQALTTPTRAKSTSLRHYIQAPLLRNPELLLNNAMYLLFTSLKHWLMTLLEKKLISPL